MLTHQYPVLLRSQTNRERSVLPPWWRCHGMGLTAIQITRLGAWGTGKTRTELKKRAKNDLSTQQRRVNMADDKNNSGPEEGIKGVVEDVKGKAKEAVGTVTGRNDMVDEGKAQQDKADAQRDAAKKEAEADAARSGADAAEKRQESNQ